MEEKTILKVVREPSFDLTVLVEDPASDAETFWDLSTELEKIIEKELQDRSDDANVARAYDLFKSGQKWRK